MCHFARDGRHLANLVAEAAAVCRAADAVRRCGPGRPETYQQWQIAVLIIIAVAHRCKSKSSQHRFLTQHTEQLQTIERRLDAFDLGRRLARNRTTLVGVDAKLRQTVTGRTHRARARLGALAGRLETLSPLAVLARGYAVCWNDERTKAIRDAADVTPGDTIHVTLSRGAIAAKVSDIE